jgi:hypothetical protein
MPKPKKVELMEEAQEVVESVSEKDNLIAIHQTLKDLNIHSISDLENLIARL